MKIVFRVRILIVIAILSTAQAIGDTRSTSQIAAKGFSVFWNGIEIWNHLSGIFGPCPHSTRLYHVAELTGHSANLAEGTWEWVQNNAPPLALTTCSFAFNLWGSWAQFDTLKSRNHQHWWAYVLSVASAIDIWGHAASAWIAGSELKHYLTEQSPETPGLPAQEQP